MSLSYQTTSISYDDIVQKALRHVIHDVLEQVSKEGFPGNHHLYITFQTHFPGVEIPTYLKERHPDEVTIVLQYQFWDLKAEKDAFCVTLSFNDIQEHLRIPYTAVTGFVDPSVKFGLQFTPVEVSEEEVLDAVKNTKEVSKKEKDSQKAPKEGSKKTASKESKVIALDAFRNKKP